jgi:hypothetical protein
MVNVTDGAHVDVGFGTFKFFLRHREILLATLSKTGQPTKGKSQH